ncbi:MAG: signal peptide peptidase SppA [Saprospiraceae bacterium]|nr:signal peptide peptidase SppA [Saprospiraceae bacterium]
MRQFFTTFLASCLGVVATFALIFILLIGMAISGAQSKSGYGNNSVLKLSLESFIPEQTDNVNQQFSFTGAADETIGLQRIITLIEHAANDKKIKGIVLENTSVSIGQASLLSLISSLQKFKESGKFVYSYADSHTQSSYMLCSVADSMFLNPQGMIDIRGYGSAIPFFKNMLDKVGVEMEVFYAGDFKSASEPFRLTGMSEASKLQTREFLHDMHMIFREIVSENRKLPADSIESIISTYSGRTAVKAKQAGLVDALYYKDQFEDMIREKTGIKPGKKIKYISIGKYDTVADVKQKSGGKDKIAIVYAEGEIVYGSEDPGVISEKKYLKVLQKIRNDKEVKAVVLRVNSPGGNAFSSEVIWHEIQKIRQAGKPVVASFGDYAASGGYYISAGADKIVAQPNTLTGSIGVFMMLPNATKLMNDKLGVNFDTIKTHPYAAGFSPFLNLTDKEKEVMQEMTMDIYDLFIKRVAEGRNLSEDSTKVIARGRVWTGRMAVEKGLVDTLGNLDTAIKIAAAEAGLEKYKTVEYPFVEPDFFNTLIRDIKRSKGEDVRQLFTSTEERRWFQQFMEIKSVLAKKDPQTRLPFVFDFN